MTVCEWFWPAGRHGLPHSAEMGERGLVGVSPGLSGIGLVRVELLGAVRAWRDERELMLGSPGQRAVLAMLALSAGQPVVRDKLVDGLWGDRPPASAVNIVHTYVARLRRVLQPERNERERIGVLSSAGHGLYVLQLGRGQLDVRRFDACAGRARQLRAGGNPAAAAESFEAASAMWHGVPLAGIPGPFAEAERARLTEQYLTMAEDHAEAMLAAGRHAQVVKQLARLTEENPFRERLAGLHILALSRNGRRGEALAAYQRTRQLLVAELGIEPRADLRELQGDILHNRDTGFGGTAGAPLAAAACVVPRQLPPGVRRFVGRRAELKVLSELVGNAEWPPGTVVISAISGAAGIGKSALALHWAHQAAGRFPEGQLYVNLCGVDPQRPPVPAADALGFLLRVLGITPGSMPAGLDERAGLYRSLLAGKRMLVVLDNARDEEQVRPLLPGSAGCMAIVTSRRQLSGLAAAEDARLVSLDVLTGVEARELLASRLGERRVAGEPEAVSELMSLCAGLPLALAAAAARAAAHPGFRLAEVAAELRDEHTRLDVLDAGDPSTSARAVFSRSYPHLAPAAARDVPASGASPPRGYHPARHCRSRRPPRR